MKHARDPLYRRHRFPAEVIGYAVWLYFRFPLSLRMVVEMLAVRGIEVSHETVRQWAEKFAREYSNRIHRLAPARGDKWHLDEVAITIRGRKHWLWRAVDQNGFVLNVLVQNRRDRIAAQRRYRQLNDGDCRTRPVAKSADLCGMLSGRNLSPSREGLGTSLAIVDGGELVAGKVEEIGDLIVNGQKRLDLSR